MDEVKTCKVCGETKPLAKFGKTEGKLVSGELRTYYTSKCTTCINIRNKERRTPEQKAEWLANKRKKRRDNKKRAVEYKGGKCNHCGGVFHIAAFDFHHIDPSQKELDVGLILQCSDAYLLKELDKCILLCANCHRIHHYEEQDLAGIKVKGRR